MSRYRVEFLSVPSLITHLPTSQIDVGTIQFSMTLDCGATGFICQRPRRAGESGHRHNIRKASHGVSEGRLCFGTDFALLRRRI